MLRLILPVVPPPQGKTDELVWYADLVGEVESCQPMGNSRYQLIVKLSKSEPGLLRGSSIFRNSWPERADGSWPVSVYKK
jgi:hypothetical protein